jgi:ABC-type multidrug transport system ATPase subunit/pSer/pThr/pTyr-binding forkhead associated (FHA) protein
MHHQSQRTLTYLLGLTGTQAGQKIPLPPSRFVIGRDAAQCQLVLSDQAVSRRHAMIEFDPQQATLTDLGSRGGTFVNGQPIQRVKLQVGDQISFGSGNLFQFTTAAPRAATGLVNPNLPRAQSVVVRIGSDAGNDLVFNAPGLSRTHATLTFAPGAGPVIEDLGSSNGTFVNGKLIHKPQALAPSDLVFLGGIVLRVSNEQIQWYDLQMSRLCAWDLAQEFGSKTILKDVSLAINQREFVGLIGPSGCGKTTLMNALNGLRPAASGTVFVNELNLYENFDTLRQSLGHVPQRDILFDDLTVERTLYYAAKLRLPARMSAADVRERIEEVITSVGLQEQRDTPFQQLSGGQQKRLSLGIELITKPQFIFLDEPTSPLDPQTCENMMELFRRLADEGRVVVMVTHRFEKFELMHHVAILTRGGRLAFFGPPNEALQYFGCREPGEIYKLIDTCDPDQLSEAFQQSPQYQRYVVRRLAETQDFARATMQARLPTAARAKHRHRRVWSFGPRQWFHLTRRYLETKRTDKRYLAVIALQPIIVALLLVLITKSTVNDAKTLFIAAIIAVWFGANNAIREIVAEVPIYRRERLVNLKIPSYVLSKFTVLSGFGLVQSGLFLSALIGFGRLRTDDFPPLLLILYLTTLGGVGLGLLISAAVNSTEKAVGLLPLIMIPQLLLSGFLKPLDDVYVNVTKGFKPATVVEYQRYEDFKQQAQQPPSTPMRTTKPPDGIIKKEGLGAARLMSDLMIVRWSLETLVHWVSLEDTTARNDIPTVLHVVEYKTVQDGASEDAIRSAYRQRVETDLQVLAGTMVVLLGLAMFSLKRKDVL